MAKTLLELQTAVRQRADMENSDFVTPEELTSYINSSITELHDLLIGSFGNDYYISEYAFNTSSATASYALPADFYKMRGVDAKVNAQQYQTLRPFNFNERNRNEDISWGLLNGPSIRYRLVGSDLVFSPAPLGIYNINLWYIPTAEVLVADSDSYADFNGYAEYVVIDAAIKCMQKEESDVSVLFAQKQAMKLRIEQMSQNRDAGSPESISDIYAEGDDYWSTRG